MAVYDTFENNCKPKIVMLSLLLSKTQSPKIFDNYLNPVKLVFIGKLSMSTHVPKGFRNISGFCIILYGPN